MSIRKGTTILAGTDINVELKSNKTPIINSSSTDTQYPSAKAVYDFVTDTKVIITSTNTPPDDSGNWELIDKEFTSLEVRENSASGAHDYITWEAGVDKTGDNYCIIYRAGHSITFALKMINKSQIADTAVTLLSPNFANIGVSALPYARQVFYCDGGNSFLMISIAGNTLECVDAKPSAISAGNSIFGTFTVTVPTNKMLDSACNKFYWKRTA